MRGKTITGCMIQGSKSRLDVIDAMQGIAMLWVVVGHHLFDFMPHFYSRLHHYIYIFHMPFFIFISSFLIAYSYKGQPYHKYVYMRFRKFFVPYVVIGIIITMLAAFKDGLESIPANLLCLIVSPKQSEATFLWYIYMLFFLYAVFPLCVKACERIGTYFEILLLAVGIYLYCNPAITPILCLDYFSGYLLFYAIGIVVAWHLSFFKKHLRTFKIVSALALVVFIVLTATVFTQSGQWMAYMILCFSAIPAMYFIACIVVEHVSVVKNVLVAISRNCFHIYLVHMFFVQAMAAVFSFVPIKLSAVGMFAYPTISTLIAIVGSVLFFKIYGSIKSKLYNTISNNNVN